MKLVYLLLYFIAVSCSAFAFGRVSSTPASGPFGAIKRAQGSFCAYTVSFFLWLLCAQYFNPRTVNPFFFALAHLAMYLSLSLTTYYALEALFSLSRGTRIAIVSILALSAGAVNAFLSGNRRFLGTEAAFFDRYDDIAALPCYFASLSIVCLALRARSRSAGGYAKAAQALAILAAMAAIDLSFLWANQSLFCVPIAIIALTLLGAPRAHRGERESSTDARIALAGVTERERAVVRGLLSGDSYARIAEREFISVHTVKSHARSAYRKLGVNTRHQLMALLAR